MKQTIFISLKWENSIILLLSRIIYNLIAVFSILNWITYIYETRKFKVEEKLVRLPMTFVELGVLVILILEIIIFTFCKDSILLLFTGIYGLVDVLAATLRDLLVSTTTEKKEEEIVIAVRNSRRWILLTFINVFQVILCFAILIYYLNCPHFDFGSPPKVLTKFNSFYYSTVSFTTLGYGDISPATFIGQFVVVLELFFFLLLALTKVPIAIGLFKAKELP